MSTALVFDTETTGTNEPQIIEAAWIKVASPFDLVQIESFNKRYLPSKPIELGATATHHILIEDLVNCPPSSEFSLPLEIDYLIGHNVDYDWKVAGEPPIKRICTLALSRGLYPSLDSHTQSAMLYFFEGSNARKMLSGAHSALCDVENCVKVLWHLIEELRMQRVIMTWEDIWQASELARIPTIMPFGKHKGTAIADIPADYKRWLLGQPDVDPYLRKALEIVSSD